MITMIRHACFVFALLYVIMMMGAEGNVNPSTSTFYMDTYNKWLVLKDNNVCYFWHLTGVDAEHAGLSAAEAIMEERMIKYLNGGPTLTPIQVPHPSTLSIVIHNSCKGGLAYQVTVVK